MPEWPRPRLLCCVCAHWSTQASVRLPRPPHPPAPPLATQYRWVPEAPPRSAGGDANGHAGTTAGLVIAILIALANLHLLVLLKFPTSVPLWLGGGARASIDGFYSAHSATANNFKAAYEAPTVIPAVE